MKYTELHSHLYGAIEPQVLWEIGKNNPKPRWEVFLKDYQAAFHEKINPETFFTDYADAKKFEKLYRFQKPGTFSQFQAKFNLIIALVEYTPAEIKKIAASVVNQQTEDAVKYAEYRFMNSPGAGKESYFSRVKAACEGLLTGEKQQNRNTQARLVVSLPRRGNYEEIYYWLKEMQKNDAIVEKYLVGIDFCHVEEGNPPSEKKPFFQKVLQDNQENTNHALAILYHVGESYHDKTPKSAVRWVVEAADYGVHRLGHCLCLGIAPEFYLAKRIKETVAERIAQLSFELAKHDMIRKFGVSQSEISIVNELEQLKGRDSEELVNFSMNEKYIVELATLIRFAIDFIKQKNICIESCPTSNLLIGNIDDWETHPLRFFAENEMNVVIGSDDPGLFATNLEKEFELAEKMGIPAEQLTRIREKAYEMRSERLSGRIQESPTTVKK